MIPLTVDVPMKRLPWANWALILFTTAVSLSVLYGSDGKVERSPLILGGPGGAPYQLVTSPFLHANLFHLIGNMLFLFVFGNALNSKLGHVGFLAAYLGLGAMTNVLWMVIGPGEPCVGASGAIMGLCGMFLVLYPRNTVRILWDESVLVALTGGWISELPGWGVVAIFLAFDLYGVVADEGSNIGYAAHIFGVLLGAGLAVVLLKAGRLKADVGEQNLLQWWSGEGPVERLPRRRRVRQERSASE